MRAPLLLSVASAAALALGACSVEQRNYAVAGSGGGAGAGAGGSAGSGGSGGAPVSTEEACAAYSEAVCARYTECLSFLRDLSYGDESVCVARYQIYCSAIGNAPGTSWTPEGLLSCASALSASTCADFVKGTFRSSTAECLPPPGSLADGAPCIDAGQCVGGYCNNDEYDPCGVCSALAGEGEACNSFIDCKLGLTCDQATGACIPAGSEGDDCVAEQTPCEYPLVCHNGKCGFGAEPGEMCDQMLAPCNATKGLFCDPTTATCKALLLVKEGAACGVINGDIYQCFASGGCDTAATPPQCFAPAEDGAACDLQAGINCMPPSICFHGSCTPPQPDGCGP